MTTVTLAETVARAEFNGEGTFYRWFFHRHGSKIDIRLVSASELPDDTGTTIWASRQPVDALAEAVVRAFDSAVAEHGEDGYRSQRGRAFPRAELEALKAAWRAAQAAAPEGWQHG